MYSPSPALERSPGRDSVPIIANGQMALINVGLGSRRMPMLIDTGATGVSVPQDVAAALLAGGEAVLSHQAPVTIADGSVHQQWVIIIRQLTIGPHVLRGVKASVAPIGAQPLLGFPILNRVGRFTIDTVRGELIFG
jgi:clan AA aspartic protease (TIGR02281 family)